MVSSTAVPSRFLPSSENERSWAPDKRPLRYLWLVRPATAADKAVDQGQTFLRVSEMLLLARISHPVTARTRDPRMSDGNSQGF